MNTGTKMMVLKVYLLSNMAILGIYVELPVCINPYFFLSVGYWKEFGNPIVSYQSGVGFFVNLHMLVTMSFSIVKQIEANT